MRELIVAMDAEELALDTRGDLRGLTADAPITPALLVPKLKGVATRDIVLLATGWGAKRAN